MRTALKYTTAAMVQEITVKLKDVQSFKYQVEFKIESLFRKVTINNAKDTIGWNFFAIDLVYIRKFTVNMKIRPEGPGSIINF